MSKGVMMITRSKQIMAAENLPWRQKMFALLSMNNSFPNSTASYSSSSASSRKSASLHNYYIRKRRKWPIRGYQHHLVESLTFQLAKRFLFKVLIQNPPPNWSEQIRKILDHIENIESFETPEGIFIDLIKLYGDNDMLDDALGLFFRMQRYRCEPSVLSLNSMLSILCGNLSGLKIVPQVLIKSREMKIRIEDSSYAILIRALCKLGKFSNALILLNHMVEEGFSVDRISCSLMLATICRHADCKDDKIMRVLEELIRLGFEPRKCDFRNVIRFLVRKGKGLDALKLLKQMKMKGIKPDVMCYSLLLDGLIQNREFPRADKVFDELLVLGLVPNVYTYNVYINGLCMQEKIEEGIEMQISMEELGCPPDLNTYNTILRALCDTGDLSRMEEMVNKIKQKALKLNSYTYDILIDGSVCKRDVHGACSLFNRMLDENIVPLPATVDKVIGFLWGNALSSKAVELLEEMVGKGVAPGARTWWLLIRGHGVALDVEKIDELAEV
ncbi:pentatricopeptide repeat-containing protein At2g38420, mitochondrial isoform X2 [Andrographis paniculata]|uniref:pentatricopeptide repeat-containing protein At2g38420, mitochondrial isoform X2 n=1 Tax=Andrographis paniculata TaxID=175694 RepID=UPI0021E77F28|nr:pentatricopeptide repeat-containing protein At2g38420, mitochondrial isoform X2 [Andrographis paniculata]